jgi:hypothetical protein
MDFRIVNQTIQQKNEYCRPCQPTGGASDANDAVRFALWRVTLINILQSIVYKVKKIKLYSDLLTGLSLPSCSY